MGNRGGVDCYCETSLKASPRFRRRPPRSRRADFHASLHESHVPRPNDDELKLDDLENLHLYLLVCDGDGRLVPDTLSRLGGGAARNVDNHNGDADDAENDIHWDVVGEEREHMREADRRCALYGGNVFVLV